MTNEDELLITYGVGYVFKENKLLIISEIEEKTILKKEINIVKEINEINQYKEKLYDKSNFNFPKDYILNIEEALEEKISNIIPMITSIKLNNKSMEKQVHLMEEYIKKDLSQFKLNKEGYIQKDLTIIKNNLDSFKESSIISSDDKNLQLLKYNKIIKKFILTTKFGNEFSNFFIKQGQADIVSKNDQYIESQLENEIIDKAIIKKKYSELDFLNLILFLEEWQKKNFIWDEKYTSLIVCINKNGKKYIGQKSDIKDFMISFIKGKRYLYFPFCKYHKANLFLNLNDKIYYNSNSETEINRYNKIIVKKGKSNLYKFHSVEREKISLDNNKEVGYLLSYNNDNVYISLVTYDNADEQISCSDKFEDFKIEMLEVLYKHFII